MNEKKLSLLYEDIKAFRGLEVPLTEFEEKYAHVRREVLKRNPAHLTVVISLWGLQFQFPEALLAKDIISAIKIAKDTHEDMQEYRRKPHRKLEDDRSSIAALVRQNHFAARSLILYSFNLMEAYLNGLAWDYIQSNDATQLSNRKRKLLEDTTSVSIRDKLRKYPSIISDNDLWEEPDSDFDEFVDILKPFRDSLVHPSPFSAPARFGGYDKLRMIYRIDYETGIHTVKLLVKLIKRIQLHIYSASDLFPEWLEQLDFEVQKIPSKKYRIDY